MKYPISRITLLSFCWKDSRAELEVGKTMMGGETGNINSRDSEKPKVYIAGAGPGDPELLTVKVAKLLEKADLIVYAGSIIPDSLLSRYKARKINSHGMKLEEIISLLEREAKAGKLVVRLQSGDPSVYSAINEQIQELERRGVECEVIPGVSSVFASAAALKVELTCPGVSEFVFIGRPAGRTLKEDYLEEVAKIPCTIVLLLGIDRIEYVVEKVSKIRGGDEPVAVVYHATRDDELVLKGKLSDIAEKVKKAGIKRTATIIIGKALENRGRRSVLYG